MARAKRSSHSLAVVEAPKQEVTTPPSIAPTKQTKVPTGRNEGTVLQDDKGKISYATSEIKADNTAGVLDDSKPDEEGVEERTTGDGNEQGQQGKKKKRSVAKGKRWTRIKTRGTSKVKPPNQQMGGGTVYKPTAKQLELGRTLKGRMERRVKTKRWYEQ